MLTNGSNQYIQPDYLSPLPTTLDSKRSPLALLAQTCSQIGADPTPCTTTATTATSSVTKSVDKAVSKKSSDYEKTTNQRKTPPQSKQYHDMTSNRQDTKEIESKSGFKSPSSTSVATSASPAIHSTQQQPDNGSKFMAEQRIALDMAMQQQNQLSKDIQQSMLANYRPSAVFPSPLGHHHPLSAYHHPGLAGLDAATAAALGAFRHPAYSNVGHHLAYPHHHVPVSLGLTLASYQQALSAVSYGRQQHLNNNKNGDASICRDPYCTGCPNSSPAPAVSSSTSSPHNSPTTSTTTTSSCPAGCSQCDHVTRTTSAVMSSTTATLSSSTPIVTSAPDTSALLRPYVCNWIAVDHYCGKRFTSSEELLQHLRTHTSLSSTPSIEPSSTSPTFHSHLNPSLHPHSAHLLAASALHRTYPTPPLSPLSMARYHPYGAANKHLNSSAAFPAPAAAPPSALLHHPYAAANLAGLPGYYSTHPYSLYSQRMLAGSAVLP